MKTVILATTAALAFAPVAYGQGLEVDAGAELGASAGGDVSVSGESDATARVETGGDAGSNMLATTVASESGADAVVVGDLLGRTVMSQDGETVGEISRVGIVEGRGMTSAIIETRSDFEARMIRVPAEALEISAGGEAQGEIAVTAAMEMAELRGMAEWTGEASAATN